MSNENIMYIINKCLECVCYNSDESAEFDNRMVEASTGGKPQGKKKDHNSDEDLVQLGNRDIKIEENRDAKLDDQSMPDPSSNEIRKRSVANNDKSETQQNVAANQISSEILQYYDGDPLINREIKRLGQEIKESQKGRASQRLPEMQKKIQELQEQTSKIKQRINFLTLEHIKSTEGNIGKIRMLLQGSVAECLRLFIEAEQAGSVITQMQLAWAFDAMCKGKDQDKDFSQIHNIKDDKSSSGAFNPCPFDKVWDIAFTQVNGFAAKEGKGAQALKKAVNLNYLPAILLNTYQKWDGNTNCYGFANELAPHVGKGFKSLDHSFGMALKNGSVSGSAPYYAGMFWMESSLGIEVMYAKPGQSLKDARLEQYLKEEGYSCDGFLHMSDGIIFAPSNEAWSDFKMKLLNGQYGLPMSYSLSHQMHEIAGLMNEFDISIQAKDAYNPYSHDQIDRSHVNGTSTIIVYDEGNAIGEISVSLKTLEICKSMEDDDEIQPLINFIKDSMTRGVSAASICSWIDLECKHSASAEL